VFSTERAADMEHFTCQIYSQTQGPILLAIDSDSTIIILR